MPFYFHCIRPNSKKQPSVVFKDLVEQQCRAQRLIRQVEICRNPPNLLNWLSDLLYSEDCLNPEISVSSSSMVQFKSVSLLEKLELLLGDREADAATKKQLLFLMITWRCRYVSTKWERRGLSNDLLAWYGPQRENTVKKLLTKYNGREGELRSKLALKKKPKVQEEKTVYQLASNLQSHCLRTHGGLDAQVKIVSVLRDMSLNPDVLESQLGDHELRGFYQKWAAYCDALMEVGENPELLLFHAEEEDSVNTLKCFLEALELSKQRVGGSELCWSQ
ncbi:uncharacterized protein PITG_22389 [Phytophthora infestans T30-4]|uniref:Myosin motor domain-containing protein n=1 Tax=Phytophthora infestans (strain T30-4) TaxID=403677 RepID=D0RM87_PHYIT|nr:uncharacterized protein PITG_22389 [Phytophthora infestans T30-4]EEY60275.1 conserved hypothetical protein [Phytophthora infestans T30-4]|eukprot:XP_002909843.1 conserved hypothetical protein [Phytophthora infestans T30-4]